MIRAGASLAAWMALAAPAAAQGAPDSAIPWLSDSLRAKPVARPGPAEPGTSVRTETAITTTSLDAPRRDGTGLLPPDLSGLPADTWLGSDPAALVAGIGALPRDMPGPLRAVMTNLLLSELEPPAGTPPDSLFLARVDALLRMGALEEAQALLERAGPTERDSFRRYFDVALLTGVDEPACAAMDADPDLSPTLPARIFCLTRGGDWAAAMLALDTAAALSLMDPDEERLVARFLDPELFEGEAPPPVPDPLTPLAFRLLDGIGERPATAGLPIAFAVADLRAEAGWKRQIEAAERLTRTGALDPARLADLYLERRPSASGGLWERAAAVGGLDAALAGSGDLAQALSIAVERMAEADLLGWLGAAYGGAVGAADVPPDAMADAMRLALLSDRPAARALVSEEALPGDAPADLALAYALARGEAAPADGPLAQAVVEGLTGPLAPEQAEMAAARRSGEMLLDAARAMADGAEAPPGAITGALHALRAAGLDVAARRLAMHLLLT
ncbi:hypothetical protein [Jannaschia sp. Os4]|uniref:hypothetical protein n=1 Tax=Jannaschia sp. Os4 TaxID=2807617 RepID=UPI001EEF6BB5|nr:hypothetical protein [Jannaschia sp. Os4]